MNRPLVLVLFCGIFLPALGPPVGANDVPENVSRDIQRLADHFNITGDKALFGNPLFLQVIGSPSNFEENARKLVLQEILDVYVRILSDMLNGTQDREVKMSIVAIRARMEDLRKSYFHSSEQVLMRRLQELWSLKTNDITVQRKAVRELLPVFESAVRLCGQKRALRRRRHAARAQPQPLPLQRSRSTAGPQSQHS